MVFKNITLKYGPFLVYHSFLGVKDSLPLVMLLSAPSLLVVAQPISKMPEELTNYHHQQQYFSSSSPQEALFKATHFFFY
jgi:hypothetical protein